MKARATSTARAVDPPVAFIPPPLAVTQAPLDAADGSDASDASSLLVSRPRGRGRPRSEAVRQNVLQAASALLDERGFRAMTIEGIAERAGASKVTLYRWWPNKAAIVMDAFLAAVSPKIPFRRTNSAINDLREQMLSFAVLLRDRPGQTVAGLLGEGVHDKELSEAFRDRWLMPRRADALRVLARAIEAGDVRRDIDPHATLDALYSPFYYRLLVKHGPLSDEFVEETWRTVMRGVVTPEARVRCRKLRDRASP
jgi:AcrR family transcriptional regulator